MDDAITFVVPAYNCADMIGATIQSIVETNLQPQDEIIIVDDGSTDDTPNVIADLRAQHPAIVALKHNFNKGSAAASRNTAIDASSNALIFCLDADNLLAPNSIKLLKNHLIANGADAAAFGELQFFTTDAAVITHKWVFREQITFADALAGSQWPGPSGNYLFTRESWKQAGRYHEHIGGAIDSWAFGIRQLATGSQMVTLPNTHYLHRHGYESTFIRESRGNNASLRALQVLLPYIDQIEDEDIEYMLSKENRLTWFSDLSTRPIRIKAQAAGKSGELVQGANGSKVRRVLQAVKRRVWS